MVRLLHAQEKDRIALIDEKVACVSRECGPDCCAGTLIAKMEVALSQARKRSHE